MAYKKAFPLTKFHELHLNKTILKTVSVLGFNEPTPIQIAAIPLVLEGHDLMGLAQTGTGKTAAFGLPLVQNLINEDIKPQPKYIRALILAPTRELVTQISTNLRAYVKGTRLRVHSITGGVSIGSQLKKLAPGTDVLVATPGRLLDLADRGGLKLDRTTHMILDEADQMLDLGFIHALRKIAKLLGSNKRQTLLFSATMPKQIEELAQTYLRDPIRVETAPVGRPADKINQSVHFVAQRAKADLLKDYLNQHPDSVSLVFARTKHGAEKLMKHLVDCGYKAGSVHGNKSQGQRDRAIRAFKSRELTVLVATDVAARGIDIPGVTHVFNFNLPEVPENYVHRIGRTARAGADGIAITFCSNEEMKHLRAIEKLMGQKVEVGGGERPEGIDLKKSDNKPNRKRPSRNKKPDFQGTKSQNSRPQNNKSKKQKPSEFANKVDERSDTRPAKPNRHKSSAPKNNSLETNSTEKPQSASAKKPFKRRDEDGSPTKPNKKNKPRWAASKSKKKAAKRKAAIHATKPKKTQQTPRCIIPMVI